MTNTGALLLVAQAGGVALILLGVTLLAGVILDPHFRRTETSDA